MKVILVTLFVLVVGMATRAQDDDAKSSVSNDNSADNRLLNETPQNLEKQIPLRKRKNKKGRETRVMILQSDVKKLKEEMKTMETFTNNTVMLMSAVRKLQSDFDDLKTKSDHFDVNINFLATFKERILDVSSGTVVFDKVNMDTGNAYSPATGVFTAPRPGLYVFTVQVFCTYGCRPEWDLYVKGQMALRSNKLLSNDDSGSYSFPATLRAGDRVNVYCHSTVQVYGENHSIFAGWLIKAL